MQNKKEKPSLFQKSIARNLVNMCSTISDKIVCSKFDKTRKTSAFA